MRCGSGSSGSVTDGGATGRSGGCGTFGSSVVFAGAVVCAGVAVAVGEVAAAATSGVVAGVGGGVACVAQATSSSGNSDVGRRRTKSRRIIGREVSTQTAA